jgi:serine/threonine-protein kinase RsbT
MHSRRSEELPVRSSNDIVHVRQLVRSWSAEIGFTLVDQTKIVTAASELARNTLQHGGGGTVRVDDVEHDARRGLRLTFADCGPGIPDIALAMRDGYTSGDGLGLGLGGARRLMNEFSISSQVGVGTTITIGRWK